VIDGVLQLDLPRSDATGAAAGMLPSFVVGPENRLLVSPVQRLLSGDDLAEAARLFNPLVLVGPSGSGKSQLTQGMVRHWRRQFEPQSRRDQRQLVEYFTAADFGREAQAAAAEERLVEWRLRIRGLRLLVVEDLQRLRRRDTIEQELRHAVDAILASGGVVVVTAECEPAALTQLDAGVRDRLAAGLTVRLQRPGLAARQAILQLAASSRSIVLTDDELAPLARREAGAPAELFGRLRDTSGSLPPARRAGDDVEPGQHNEAVLKRIIAVTARYFMVTQAALTGPSRRTSLVRARNIVVHLARRLTGLSYAAIGRALGGRDHTTIMHADRRLTDSLANDPATQQAIDELDRLLR
jgi:chromosomal replication initiator protein